MRTVRLKLSAFGRKFSDKIVKPAFYVSIGTFRGKYFLEFIKTFPNMERKFRLFVIFFSEFVKTIIYRSRGTVRWKKLFEKGTFSDHFRKMSGKFLAVWQILFDWVVKNACYVSVGFYGGEKTSETKFFCQFWFLNENSLAFCRIFFRGVVKFAFYVSIGTNWRKKNSPTKFVFYQTLTNSEHFWHLAGNFQAGFSKLHYTCSLKQFQKKISGKAIHLFIILGNWLNFFCFFGSFFRLNYQNCIVRVCRKSLRKFIFELDKVFHQMRTVSIKNRSLLEFFPTGLSNLHWTCQ